MKRRGIATQLKVRRIKGLAPIREIILLEEVAPKEQALVLEKEWLQTLIRKQYQGSDPILLPEVVSDPYLQLFHLFSFQKFFLSLVDYLWVPKTFLT